MFLNNFTLLQMFVVNEWFLRVGGWGWVVGSVSKNEKDIVLELNGPLMPFCIVSFNFITRLHNCKSTCSTFRPSFFSLMRAITENKGIFLSKM